MKKLRLLLVDDHAVVREGLRSLLSDGSRFDIVGDAADGVAALAEVERLKPDVVVVDVSLPGMNGTQLTRRLKQLYPDIRTIALTVHEEGGYLRSLMDAGASGYVLKRSAASELRRRRCSGTQAPRQQRHRHRAIARPRRSQPGCETVPHRRSPRLLHLLC